MNNWLEPSIFSTFFASLILIIAYGYVFFKEKKRELKYFLFAWIIYALRFICNLLQIETNLTFLSYFGLIATLLSSAFLFIAARTFFSQKPQKALNYIFFFSPVVVLVLWIINVDIFIVTAAAFFISGTIYILVGINFLKNKSGILSTEIFIALVFMLWGLHKFDYPFLYDSIAFAPIGFLLGFLFSIISALSILMLFYEYRIKAFNEKVSELQSANEAIENSNVLLLDTKKKLQLKLDYILSPDLDEQDLINITDIIDIDLLQEIQNSFSNATGVTAIITDINGVSVTKPSNFNEMCKIIRQTKKGLSHCIEFAKSMGLESAENLSTNYRACTGCGFVEASAPIFVGNKHLANWIIGQTSFSDINEEKIKSYAEEIDVNSDILLAEFRKVELIPYEQFKKRVDLLWLFSKTLSSYAYHNIKLTRKLVEERKIKEELAAAKAVAEENSRLKSAFLANVSHEIRTPLNGVLGFAEFLKYDKYSEEDRKRFFNLMDESGKRLMKTIDDIIDISIINSGKMDFSIDSVSISSLLNDVLSAYEQEINSKGIDFKYVNPGDYNILTDEEKLKKILSNVLDNAVKFTEQGRIELNVMDKDEDLEFTFFDTGIGISKDKFKSIYNSFEQVDIDYSRRYEGLGLGLSIAKSYLDLMGGSIRVDSKAAGKGKNSPGWTRFTILIPKA